MAIVNSDFLTGVMTNFRLAFDNALFDAARNAAPWMELAREVPSTTDTENHSWLGTVPKMVDTTQRDLEVSNLLAFNYAITNKTWKAGFEVERSTFEDDRLNMIPPKITQLAEEAARHPGELIMTLPDDNGLAFDGVAWTGDTRVIGASANIDNNKASLGSGTTIAGFQADLGAARALLRTFQNDKGRPMNSVGNVVMVPPSLEQVAYQALVIAFPAAAPTASNVVPATTDGVIRVNGYSIYVNPFLTAGGANDWYLMAVDGSRKPFVYQTRIAPALEGITTPTTETGIIRDRFVYTARARYNVGYGDPRLVVKIVN
jgi:phage major head subunit gpT-like protein